MISNLNEDPADSGTTPLDADEQAQLIPSFATRSELNAFERMNILDANAWALGPRVLKRSDPFIESYIRQLHKRMFDQTWKWAGKYRTTNKNLGVPFHRILNDLAVVLGNTHYWMEHRTFDLDEIAIRYHHGLVSIHPFPNGNGRHARLLADVVVMKYGRERFSWGSKQFVDVAAARAEYIRCLKAADANNEDIQGLLRFARS